jgi:hypothetical protein
MALHRQVPVIPIIGARKPSQMQENPASVELTLSPDQLKTLDNASRFELRFPHDLCPGSVDTQVGRTLGVAPTVVCKPGLLAKRQTDQNTIEHR